MPLKSTKILLIIIILKITKKLLIIIIFAGFYFQLILVWGSFKRNVSYNYKISHAENKVNSDSNYYIRTFFKIN